MKTEGLLTVLGCALFFDGKTPSHAPVDDGSEFIYSDPIKMKKNGPRLW